MRQIRMKALRNTHAPLPTILTRAVGVRNVTSLLPSYLYPGEHGLFAIGDGLFKSFTIGHATGLVGKLNQIPPLRPSSGDG